MEAPGGSALPRNLGFDESRKLCERLLPAQIAHLDRNGLGQPFLHYVDLSSARHLLQGHRRLHFSAKVWVVELVRIANTLVRRQLEIGPAKRVTLAGAEVGERNPMGTADPRIGPAIVPTEKASPAPDASTRRRVRPRRSAGPCPQPTSLTNCAGSPCSPTLPSG